MNNNQHPNPKLLCAIVGSGDLVSHIHRVPKNDAKANYRFNLVRVKASSSMTGAFRPKDLRNMVKACQVIAFEIAHDGWNGNRRQELLELAKDLSELTQKWDQTNEE